MTENINYINGAWNIDSDSMVPVYDGGFLLGDGLFETIRFDNKKLFYPDKHLKRLFDGLDIIRIKLEKSCDDIIHLLQEIIQQTNLMLLTIMIFTNSIETMMIQI